jgi:hypothetical protein
MSLPENVEAEEGGTRTDVFVGREIGSCVVVVYPVGIGIGWEN